MKIAMACLLAVSMYGCDVGSPQKVSAQFHDALVPYFPNAHVKLLPNEGIIAAATCVQGAGPGLINQVAEFVHDSPDVQQLRDLRQWGPILGNPSYKYVMLGFDKSLMMLDVDSWQIIYPELPPNYEAEYREECGLQAPTQEGSRQSVSTQYIRIGYFLVTLAQPYKGKMQSAWVDSLGVYALDSDFEAQRPAELEAREVLIKKWFTARHIDVVAVKLERIDKVPL